MKPSGMKTLFLVVAVALVVLAGMGPLARQRTIVQAATRTTKPRGLLSGKILNPDDLDSLLAPIALYPDQLLAQILLCAGTLPASRLSTSS